jgi:hypothetical protein
MERFNRGEMSMNHLLPSSKRRIFFGSDADIFQIFSIEQNKNDGSIYFCAPGFEEIMWTVPALGADEQPVLLSFQNAGDGKLSLHGSGVTHVRPYGSVGLNDFSIRGNELRSRDGERLGVRHLITTLLSEPKHRPNSPAMARQSDFAMNTTQWHPYVVIFWAVPANRPMSVSLTGAFHEDDLEEVPPNGGWGSFTLQHHAIVWFAYRTKHMDRWPLNTQAFYSDGHTVPVLIGTGVGQFRIEYRQPTYSLTDDILSIQL